MTKTVAILRHSLYQPSEHFIPDQARALGQPVVMVSRDAPVNEQPELRIRSIAEFGPTARGMYASGFGSKFLTRILQDEDCDVLHAHFGVEGSYAVPAAEKAGVPLVTTLHGFDVSVARNALLASRKPSWVRYALKRSSFLRNSEALICVSHHVARLAVELGARESAIEVINTGVDLARFPAAPCPAAPVVLHVARLVPKKGTGTLLAAFAKTLQRLPDARLRIVGGGPLEAQLKILVSELGIDHAVDWLGVLRHDDIVAEMLNARVVCAPSVTGPDGDTEGLPQVVLEASACARPVVGTRHAGIPEAVVDGVSGLLVPERSEDELRAALVTLLSDETLAMTMGIAARARVEQEYDLSRQAGRVVELYNRLRK